MAEALLNLVGWFWRAATPEKQVPGRLTIDGTGRILLKVSESLRDGLHLHFGTSSRNDGLTFHEQHFIHGYCGQPVTLYQCQRIYGSYRGTEDYEAIYALVGEHFAEETRFNLVTMHFENLSNWVGWEPDLSASVEFNFRGKDSRVNLARDSEDLVIDFNLGDQYSIDEIVNLCSHAQMLGKIGLCDSAPMTKIAISQEKGDAAHELFTNEIRKDNSADSNEYFQIFKTNTIFHFNDIDGLSGMARWVEIAEKFRPVIALLKDSRKNPTEHLEANAIKNIIAAETFAKIQLGVKRVKFGKALAGLAKYAGETFEESIQSPKWAQEIAILRNDMIHPSTSRIPSPEKMYWLSETIYYLLILCMLRECGVPEKTLTAIQKHGMLEWVAEESRRYL